MATKKEKDLQKIVEEECSKYIKDARTQIRKKLEIATLSLLGLEADSHRGYEIDHCNGRNSVLIDAFRECAIEEAKKIATNYKPSSESVIKYANAFQEEFNRQFNSAMRDMAKTKAKEEAEKIIGNIHVDVDNVLKIDG